MGGVLAGIRVVDVGRYVAAPYCATLLGYLGADVIRVEKPGGGDDRHIAPVNNEPMGAVFLQTGCNKRSLCLNLSDPNSTAVRDRLIASADVLVSNYPVHRARQFGFDLASLQAIRENIILANVSAFGATGPYAERGGFDGIGQAMSGAMYITGTPGNPGKAAAPYVDYSSAVLLAFGVMAALRERDQSGRGQEVSASLLGTALAVFNSHLVEQGVLGVDRVGTGNRVQTSAPSDVFATLDGHVLVHCPGNKVFRQLAVLIGKNEWLDDARFTTDQQRGDHRDTICEPVAAWCAHKTTQEALELFAQASIPAGPVLSPREALAHDQVAATELVSNMTIADIDKPVPIVDLPLNLSTSETGIRSAPPTVGEHTDSILNELGYTSTQIKALRASGVVA